MYPQIPETVEPEAIISFSEVASPEDRQNHFQILQDTIELGDIHEACKMAGAILGLETLHESDIPGGVEYLGVGPVYNEQGPNRHHKDDARAVADAAVMRVGRMHVLGDEIAVDGVDGRRHHFTASTEEDLVDLRARLGARGYRVEGDSKLAPIEEAYNEAFTRTSPEASAMESATQRFSGTFTGIMEQLAEIDDDPLATQKFLPARPTKLPRPDLWDTEFINPAMPGPWGTARLSPVETRKEISKYYSSQAREVNTDTPAMATHEVLLVARQNLETRALLLSAWGECGLEEAAQLRSDLTTMITGAMNNIEPILTGKQLNAMMAALSATSEHGKAPLERREAQDALNQLRHLISLNKAQERTRYSEDDRLIVYPDPQRIKPTSRPNLFKRIIGSLRPRRGRHAA